MAAPCLVFVSRKGSLALTGRLSYVSRDWDPKWLRSWLFFKPTPQSVPEPGALVDPAQKFAAKLWAGNQTPPEQRQPMTDRKIRIKHVEQILEMLSQLARKAQTARP